MEFVDSAWPGLCGFTYLGRSDRAGMDEGDVFASMEPSSEVAGGFAVTHCTGHSAFEFKRESARAVADDSTVRQIRLSHSVLAVLA